MSRVVLSNLLDTEGKSYKKKIEKLEKNKKNQNKQTNKQINTKETSKGHSRSEQN